ncbi:Epithelial cell-transforming sequence 2 oncogene-like [Holothuria leucospilota]|uniref:Epithelial cell-transforming sequence 2 oncogene-like n=1 Tax=Holothuria leucospilota TaxID=206669 RepID=A0A9Q1BIJ4_HOLLE|nr:Epithelial cell-transforming sequence 2 oncogene-like [Holothuria leucospilota]
MAANHQRDRKSPSQPQPGIPATTHSSSQSVQPLKNKKTAHVAPLQSSTLVPFQSTMLQTKHSTWTPVLHKPSNEQLYVERRDLIGHWFDMWTDLQRKRFLRYILGRCKRNQINFLHKFFNDNIPVTHADFTKYLPRFLSLYIFSFLDPRSLSRAGMVCWHWKFLTEQDTLWMPKCIRQGWFLPYTPKVNEYGSWKLHYIKCLQSLDVAHPKDKTDLYGRQSDGSRFLSEEELEKKRRALELKNADKKATMVWRERPPWLDPDPKPGDLIQSQNLLIASANPKIDPTRVRGHLRSFTEPSGRHIEYGLDASGRKLHHRSTTEGEQMLGSDQKKLSSVVAEEAFEDRGDAVEQPWPSPQRSTSVYRRKDLSGGGGDYTISRSSGTFSPPAGSKVHPKAQDIRAVLISSNVPAYEILCASIKPYVTCLCYDYDSTTMEALQEQVEDALTGVRAKSVAIITRGLDEVNLVKNVSLSNKSLEKPELKQFFEILSTLMVTASEGAHLDIFAPLAATERGSALETDLSRLTGVQVTSPDVIGNDPFMHVCSGVWSSNPEKDVLPPFLYFEENKLRLWQVEALRTQEAIRVCRENMERFYQNKMGSRLARVTGEAVLESLQEEKEDVADKLIPALKKAVEALSEEEKESVDPVEFVSEYLANLKGKLPSTSIKSADKMGRGQKEMTSNLWEKDFKAETQEARLSETNSAAEEIEEESIADDLELGSDFGQSEKLMKFTSTKPHKPMGTTASMKPQGLGTYNKRKMDEEILEPMDRKSSFSQIVRSEKDFVNVLDILHDVFMKKLQSALNSNKAITSLPNIDLMFSDANVLRNVHRPFLEELESRLTEWNSQQCVGDCFIKLQSKLKAYTNFHNNYPVILSTIDKCREQEPSFRAFLKRHNRTPETRMSTLQELFLILSCRIQDYIRLLTHQEHCTPVDHADRADLSSAIRTFQDLQERIDQNRRRGETERSLKLLQKKILGCPNLLEANRHLIREEHVAQLRQEAINISTVPFQQIQNLCLFLFNDALMVTVECKQHIPYTREVCTIFKFQAAVSLTKLRVEDVPDSRYASNVFLLKTPKRQWLCSLPTYSTKLSWITILEETIHAAMDVD